MHRFFRRDGICALKAVNQEKSNDFLKRNLIGCDLSALFLFFATVGM